MVEAKSNGQILKPMFDHLCAVTKVRWYTLMGPIRIMGHQSLMVFKQECQGIPRLFHQNAMAACSPECAKR